MNLLNKAPGVLTRFIPELKDHYFSGSERVVKALDYMTDRDREEVKRLIATRYCSRVKKQKNKNNNQTTIRRLAPIQAAQEAIQLNIFEIVTTGLYNKIINEMADLYSHSEFYIVPTSIEGPAENARVKDIEKIWRDSREESGFWQQFGQLDKYSVACGTSVLKIEPLGHKLDYQPISINNIWVVYSHQINDNGIVRPTNKQDINEASAVIVKLGTIGNKRHWVAYFGASDKYPNGRQVKYISNQWDDIPDDYSDGDYIIEGSNEMGNPLTVLKKQINDPASPEYPIAMWYGGMNSDVDELLEVDDSLYWSCLELDVAHSRMSTAALKSASGIITFRAGQGSIAESPKSLTEGLALLREGEELNVISIPGSNVTAASDFFDKLYSRVSEKFEVPAYKLAMSNMSTVPSGTALQVLDRPAVKKREKRQKTNQQNMKQIWNIERAWARYISGRLDFAKGLKQEWRLKDQEYPGLETRKDAGPIKPEPEIETPVGKGSRIRAAIRTVVESSDSEQSK